MNRVPRNCVNFAVSSATDGCPPPRVRATLAPDIRDGVIAS